MRKGVVIKLNKNRATLMTEDCAFCDVKPFNGMYEGMEVCFSEIDILKRKTVFKEHRYVTAACFLLLVFCSYLFLSFYQENIAAYAYVGIDINPSIEIALNKKGRIINARGLDEEGTELLESINVRKMDSTEGIKQIIAKTIDMNYLEQNDGNDITVYAIMEKENNKDGSELIQKVEKVIKEEVAAHSIKGEVKTFVSEKKVKNQADMLGMSVVQYISREAKMAAAHDKEDKDIKGAKGKDYGKDEKNKDKEDKDDKKDKDNKKDEKNKPDENKKNDKVEKDKEKEKDKNIKNGENKKGNSDKSRKYNYEKNKKSGNQELKN